MHEEKPSFWTTLPGILTGLAALITAVGGIVVFVYPQKDKPPPEIHPRGAAILIDDSDPRVHLSGGGGWKHDADRNVSQQTQSYTDNPGSTVTLDFRGDWIEVAYYKSLGGALKDGIPPVVGS